MRLSMNAYVHNVFFLKSSQGSLNATKEGVCREGTRVSLSVFWCLLRVVEC